MRRLRNDPAGALSLFSFQDVMMTVMGILILVTLILALQLAESVATAVAETTDPAEPSGARSEVETIRQLQDREAELRARFESQLELFEQVVQPLSVRSQELEKAEVRLEQLAEQRRRLQAQVEQVLEEGHPGGEEAERLHALRRALAAAEAERDRLEAAIRERRGHPRLTYLLQEGVTKRPVLLELAEEAWWLGRPEAPDTAIALRGPASDRLARLLEVAAQLDPRRDYVVLLLKPSAIDDYRQVRRELDSAGFDLGLEYVEEGMRIVAPGTAPATERAP